MYFKLLNKNECHHGLQYKTGLNTLLPNETFNPSGDCEPGGIYFASADIFEFLGIDEYVYIREVTLPADAQIYKNPSEPEKWKADKVILGRKRRLDNLKTIQWMFDNGAKSTNRALECASTHGHYEVVNLLIENGAKVTDWALDWASENGHTKIAKLLEKYI